MHTRNLPGTAYATTLASARALEPRKLMAPRAVKALPERASSAFERAPDAPPLAVAMTFLYLPDHHTHSLGYGIDE